MKRFVVVVGLALCLAIGGFRFYKSRSASVVAANTETAQAQLSDAQRFIDDGKLDQARPLLEALVKDAEKETVQPQTLVMLARLEDQTGNTKAAISLLERAVRDYQSDPDHSTFVIAYARCLEKDNQIDRAKEMYEQVRASAPPKLRAPALTGLGRLAHQMNTMKSMQDARRLYREAVRDAEWDGDAWSEAVDALGKVDVMLIFSVEATEDSQEYILEKGDNITSIGIKLNTTQGLLTRANSITETTKLDVGQRLKYTPKDFRIVIERSTCRLFLLDKNGLFKMYSCGLGMPGHETTLGSYKIGNKEKDPIWHKPGFGPIPAGDPQNELGTRWMPLVPLREGLPKDLGIHGTIRPDTIGAYSSHGCARLYKEEVEELYDLVVRSTEVDIVETVTPETILPVQSR